MNKQEIEKAINHLTMLRRLDSGEKKSLYDTAISALQQQLTNGWIPVDSMGLPDNERYHNTYVTLEYTETGHRFSTKMVWEYGKFKWFNGKSLSDKYRVVAWKYEYMPEPYKEVSK